MSGHETHRKQHVTILGPSFSKSNDVKTWKWSLRYLVKLTEQSQHICLGQNADIEVFQHTHAATTGHSSPGRRARWLRMSPKGITIPASSWLLQ